MISLKKSFSARLSLYIILITALIFLAALAIFYSYSRNAIRTEAIRRGEALLNATQLRVDNILQNIENTAEIMAWDTYEKLESPDAFYAIAQQTVKENPNIIGCAIAFEPYHYKNKGYFFSPYAYQTDSSIITSQLGDANYNYFAMDWYLIPKLLNRSYWSEPYFDEGGANGVVSTYSLPLHDAKGRFIGVFTADVSLEWLSQLVSQVKPYPSSYTYVLSQGACFLVQPNWNNNELEVETIFTIAMSAKDTLISAVGKRMINGETGTASLRLDGISSLIFFAPVLSTHWSISLVCPETEVYASLSSMNRVISTLLVIGLVLLFGLCYIIINYQTRPLRDFSNAAKIIAKGNFSAALPHIHTKDEMWRLYKSFDFMQTSLVKYIDELRETTASKERIDSELRIASEIQMGMIPKKFPPFPDRVDIDLFASMTPAKEVGGDLYDFYINDEKLYFIIGDVSGKGVPASLLMAVTVNLFRSASANLKQSNHIVNSINQTISSTNPTNMFVTLFLGILDLKTGVLDFCNAGHNRPVFCGKTIDYLQIKPNIAVGLFEGFDYQSETLTFSKGDVLITYTDGLTEAENVEQTLYGDEQLLSVVRSLDLENMQSVVEILFNDVRKHAGEAEQSDDLTIMAIAFPE